MTPEQYKLVANVFEECVPLFKRAEWDALVAMSEEHDQYQRLRAYILHHLTYSAQNGGMSATACMVAGAYIKETYK